MRWLKLFEGWSDDYITDFEDNGFQVSESPTVVRGRYEGDFIITDLNDWYAEMIGKMSDDYNIIKSATSWNKSSKIASFEIQVADKEQKHITLQIQGEDVKLQPRFFKNYLCEKKSGRLGDYYKKNLGYNLDIVNLNRYTLGVDSISDKNKTTQIYITIDEYTNEDGNILNCYLFIEIGRRINGIEIKDSDGLIDALKSVTRVDYTSDGLRETINETIDKLDEVLKRERKFDRKKSRWEII